MDGSDKDRLPDGAEPPSTVRRSQRPRRRHAHWWVAPVRLIAWMVIGIVVLAFAALALTGRPISAPEGLVRRIEDRANRELQGTVQLRLGGIEAILDDTYIPRVRLTGVQILSLTGGTLAVIPDLRAAIDPGPLLKGTVAPKSLRMTGATIALRRNPDGRFDLLSNATGAVPQSVSEALDAIDRAFANPVLVGIDRIEVGKLRIRLDDQRTGKRWDVSDGTLTLDQTAESVAIALGFDLAGQGTATAHGEIDFMTRKNSREARMEARVRDVLARDLAAQSPALAWLGALDAPISGEFRTGVDDSGALSAMSATLNIGAGALRPDGGAAPVGFKSAAVTMAYDPAAGLLTFSDLALDSPQLRVRAEGEARLTGDGATGPDGLVSQISISNLTADPEGVFSEPVSFSQGAADIKLTFEPFSLRLGQLSLTEGERRIEASGRVSADDLGWKVALDAGMNRISADRLLALWPVRAVPKTREWLKQNVATADLSDVRAALRLSADAPPKLYLGYNYDAAEVRFLKTLPPILDGAGYATINDTAYTLVLDRGHVIAPGGGRIDASGSVLEVTDILAKPAPARITLRTDSDIGAALSLLDEPPFRFLTKAGRPTDVAKGRARLETVLDFPLKPKLQTADVKFLVTGQLTDVTSDRLVPGRDLVSESLSIRATPAGMEIGGRGTLSGVPFDATWTQRFGPEHAGRSRVAGSVERSPGFLEAFRIGLPKGMVTGQGEGLITLDLAKGAPTRFNLTSDLVGLGLKIAGIGWSKGAGASGKLSLEGSLGTPPVVERLDLDADGLRARGSVFVKADGGLDVARFDEVRLGQTFAGALDLKGRGKGRPVAVVVRNGTADLRQADFGGAGREGQDMPIEVALDRLRISETIALTGFRGQFGTAGGFNGTFAGRVNDVASVEGTAVPVGGGTGFRVRSDNAGGVLAGAGIFAKGRGGSLQMTLRPTGEPKTYDGDAEIENFRVTDAPVLAELLGVISVVGLLEQLNGQGLAFTDAQATFRLAPDGVTIREASAVGASMGISASGFYRTADRALSLSGTISPVYLLNGIGQIFTKRREGLFGFNYQMTGTPDDVSVRVNPLSILTPGMFRELFRAPPPKVGP